MNRRIFLFAVILIFIVRVIFPKGGDDRGNKDRDMNSQDKGYRLREEKKLDNEQDRTRSQKKNRIQLKEGASERIKNCINLTDESQKLSKEISRNIKKDNYDDLNYRSQKIKNNLDMIKEEKENLYGFIDDEQKKDIKEQISVIEESQEKINSRYEQFEIEINKEKKNKEKILKLNYAIEKEMNKIERQFRAIEWILSEE